MHVMSVEIRGQLCGGSSCLPPLGSWGNQTQVTKFVRQAPYLAEHLISSSVVLSFGQVQTVVNTFVLSSG